MLNVTHLEHTLIAIGIQAIILMVAWVLHWLSVPVVILSAVAPSLLFFGREQAQAESRIQEELHTKDLPWSITMNACHFWDWEEDSQADFMCPLLACMAVCIGLCFFL